MINKRAGISSFVVDLRASGSQGERAPSSSSSGIGVLYGSDHFEPYYD
jgi:hypothetical protein